MENCLKVGQVVRIKAAYRNGKPDHKFVVTRISKGKSCCSIVDIEQKGLLVPQQFIKVDFLEK